MSTVQRHYSPVISGCRLQVPQSDQVVRCDREGEHPFHAVQASMPKLPEAAHGLQPTEDLFHALPLLLTDLIAGVSRGALVDRTAAARGVLGHMRGGVAGSRG